MTFGLQQLYVIILISVKNINQNVVSVHYKLPILFLI